MKIDKEQLALRRASITKGMRITADVGGPVTFAKSHTETPLEEASRRIEKACHLADQLAEALRQRRQ